MNLETLEEDAEGQEEGCELEKACQAEHVWISPLLPIYWFFDLRSVASTNLHIPYLRETSTIWEVTRIIEGRRMSLPVQERSTIPI